MNFSAKYIICIAFSLTSIIGTADCTFKTGDYIDELNNYKKINRIDIEVSKSAKFAKNFLKIITTKSENIPSELKKSFNAKILVEYEFGECIFAGKVKQNGDWKDHISFKNGKPIRSLNVTLNNGNIANAIKFKLLIPNTRNDLAEIFGISIMKNIGFITPETFKVNVILNGVQSEMIFQEDSRKELLERNLRREGPIFEGDETLLWGNGMLLENDRVSLSRLVNDNWFLKGSSSRSITLNAYKRLQLAYLSRVEQKTGDFIQPNKIHPEIFDHYHFIMLALDGDHGLGPHNRKFYFNSFIDDFEPIYYDGDLMGSNVIDKNNEVLLYMNNIDLGIWSAEVKKNSFKNTANYYFNQRSKLSEDASNKIFLKYWEKFISNISTIEKTVKHKNEFQDINEIKTSSYSEFIKRADRSIPGTSFIKSVTENDEGFYDAIASDDTTQQLSLNEVASIIKRNKLKNSRTTLIDTNITEGLNSIKKYDVANGKIFATSDIKIDINISSRKIKITQLDPKAWAYFNNVNLANWEVIFKGQTNSQQPQDGQRFNAFGLTGCLNFFNSNFKDTNIYVENGSCEDSLNIVKSKGNINNVSVKNAMADAIDLDFSDLNIQQIVINNAMNDCLDVSGGTYKINQIKGTKCFDKFISVGEKSNMFAENLFADGALIGISAKDLSQVVIKNGIFKDIKICAEAYQKKEEFGGGKLNIENLECYGERNLGPNSIIYWNSK